MSLAAGAFVLWGPVGLGNGPVSVAMSGAEGWTESAGSPVLAPLPIYYSGHREAAIDGAQLVGGTRYPVPHVQALEVLATCGICAIGIKLFSASGQFDEAVCTTRDPKVTETAMDAAVAAS